MCKAASSTVATLLAAIEPTLIDLLTVTGIAETPQGQEAINAFNVALQAVQNWKPGSSAQDVIQVIKAFIAVFNTLPLPPEVEMLANIISAGVIVVIGVLTGNSPAPAATEGATASVEEIQDAHGVMTATDYEKQVQVLVPGFKRSIFHSPASQYKSTWNGAVAKVTKKNPKYGVLKVS